MPIAESAFWVVFAVCAAWFRYGFARHGGFRGMPCGSALARTAGEVQLGRRLGMTTIMRVHMLEDGKLVLENLPDR